MSRSHEIPSTTVFTEDDFETDLAGVDRYRLRPGEVLRSDAEPSDVAYIVVDGCLGVDHGGTSDHANAPAVVRSSAGATRLLLSNVGDRTAEFVCIRVPHEAEPGPDDAVEIDGLDPLELSEFWAHDGVGAIGFRTVFDDTTFASTWNSIDHLVVPPGTTVGYHRNEGVEEVFVLVSGRGRMRIDGEVVDVGATDCIANRLGGSHGLANPFDEPLELLNVSVRARNGLPDAVDLGDDLSDLL